MEGRYVNIVIPRRQEYLTLCEVEVIGQPSGNTDPTGTNIAKGGKVTQSSLYENAVPERAIDGNHASSWPEGSCAHTRRDQNPWWSLDLLKTYAISTVTVTNRRDCCPERLNGAEIRIGNCLIDNSNANPRCAVISSIAAGTTQTFVCKGMEGRYVNIVIPGRQEYLTLCEVEVTGQPSGTNIAKGGKVTQSSLYENAVPERAIDGNRASNWPEDSCSATEMDQNPWWSLDLLKTYSISTDTITNRQDCCHDRLNGAEIHIGNSLNDNDNDNANPRCAVISSISPGASQTFVCKGMEGRYVNIVIPGRQEYLTLCEVEVTGVGGFCQPQFYRGAIRTLYLNRRQFRRTFRLEAMQRRSNRSSQYAPTAAYTALWLALAAELWVIQFYHRLHVTNVPHLYLDERPWSRRGTADRDIHPLGKSSHTGGGVWGSAGWFFLRGLNKYLHPQRCKMLTVPRVRQSITAGDWFATIDLKEAAPRTFTRCMDAVIAPMRQRGLRILNYLDDWLICADSEDLCRCHVALLLEHTGAWAKKRFGRVKKRFGRVLAGGGTRPIYREEVNNDEDEDDGMENNENSGDPSASARPH
ncbi:uncharacterized protein LOC123968112 [Micropterus dolomieu]|uniref:uncharacterized protein LOC123968112 n=1 Tax=Micropterus dolomieu TaxID=147949 RepID=UPI001E8DA6C3|nr:uncharacterized protein LOC123968112 [Micropterus dolomieu]